MSLIPVDAEYHYVQDTAPTTANAGDVWLDTSVNPPVAKIYADVGNGLEWLQDQSSDRIATNLDAPVSEAGQGVDWSSKTFVTETVLVGSNGSVTVSGSGYLFAVYLDGQDADSSKFSIDGSTVWDTASQTYYFSPIGSNTVEFGGRRFENSFTVSDTAGYNLRRAHLSYALD
jgi:hypothetical protein